MVVGLGKKCVRSNKKCDGSTTHQEMLRNENQCQNVEPNQPARCDCQVEQHTGTIVWMLRRNNRGSFVGGQVCGGD